MFGAAVNDAYALALELRDSLIILGPEDSTEEERHQAIRTILLAIVGAGVGKKMHDGYSAKGGNADGGVAKTQVHKDGGSDPGNAVDGKTGSKGPDSDGSRRPAETTSVAPKKPAIPDDELRRLHQSADGHVQAALAKVKGVKPALKDEIRKAAHQAAEAAYEAKAKTGAKPKKSRDAAKNAAKKAARDAAERGARKIAIDAADKAISDGSVFDTSKLAPDAKTQLKNYGAGKSGGAGKRLAPQLDGKTYDEMRSLLEKEVTKGTAQRTDTKLRDPTDPTKKKMQTQLVYEFVDGTLVRIKPKGDKFTPGKALYSVEVKQAPPSDALSGQAAVAFKLDEQGRPVPKGPSDIKNPYDKGAYLLQWDAFQQRVMLAGHRQAKQP